MTTLDRYAELAAAVSGLSVVSTLRADGTIHSSVVNAGVMTGPATGRPGLAFVTYGKVKLANLRERPQVTATVRSGWQWATVEGTATIIGPDDPADGFDADRIRLLLREVFVAAGGSHDDWDGYDATMAEQRRAAVIVEPARVYGVWPSEHAETD